jgi:hypothetical protein
MVSAPKLEGKIWNSYSEFTFQTPTLTDASNNGQGQQNLDKPRQKCNQSKITWALGTFKPFKSAGTDEIIPVLLQQGVEHLVPHSCRAFRACLAYGFTPMARKQVRVMCIPKPRKSDCTKTKAYCHISLSSFLLKMMEKLANSHIRNGILKEHPLYQNQHVYQISKPTETALHNVVTLIESAIKYKETALGAFLDIVGAFDRT